MMLWYFCEIHVTPMALYSYEQAVSLSVCNLKSSYATSSFNVYYLIDHNPDAVTNIKDIE